MDSIDAMLAGPPVKKLLLMTDADSIAQRHQPHWSVRLCCTRKLICVSESYFQMQSLFMPTANHESSHLTLNVVLLATCSMPFVVLVQLAVGSRAQNMEASCPDEMRMLFKRAVFAALKCRGVPSLIRNHF